MVSHLNSFKYVEMDGEFFETPCQTFEVVDKVSPTVPKAPSKMASLKDARVVIEEGGFTVWGQLPNIPYKSDKFGLGFTSQAQKASFMLVLILGERHSASTVMEFTIIMSMLWKTLIVTAT